MSISNALIAFASTLAGSLLIGHYVRKKAPTIEDDYQRKRANLNDGAIIVVSLEFNDVSDEKAKSKEHLSEILSLLEDRLLEYNFNYDNLQFPFRLHKPLVFYNRIDFHNCKRFHYKFLIDKENSKIIAHLKHEYIGGSYLLDLFYCCLKTKQPQTHVLFPKTNPLALLYTPFLLLDRMYASPVTPLPLLSDVERSNEIAKYDNATRFYTGPTGDSGPIGYDNLASQRRASEMRRFLCHYYMDLNNQGSYKVTIIHKLLSDIYRSLNLTRNLHCYIPIAFQPKHEVANNIGLFWIEFDPEMLICELEEQMQNNVYQTSVTNALLNYGPRLPYVGTEVRRNVDCVVSFMLGTEDAPDVDITASWTFQNISEYPVYAAVASVKSGNRLSVTHTLTFSTPAFNGQKLSCDDRLYTEKSLDYYM